MFFLLSSAINNATSKICSFLSRGGKGGAAAADLLGKGLDLLSGNRGQDKLAYDVQSGFNKLNAALAQVSNQLKEIKGRLDAQQEAINVILELVTNIRYKEGMEKIQAAYFTLLEGSHDLENTLQEMSSFIYELNTDNNQHLCLPKIKEFLDLIRNKDQLKAKEMASYVVTVKAQYLIIVSLYYTYKKDKVRVQREWEKFNGDANTVRTR